jgi:2-polyprenyl-6-methoxyphenol hydroxylase-like FAD-dependent oxidoreductase
MPARVTPASWTRSASCSRTGVLRRALRETAEAAEHVTLLQPARAAEVVRDVNGVRIALEDSRLLTAPLLIGAEGRNSPTREAAAFRSPAGAMITRR